MTHTISAPVYEDFELETRDGPPMRIRARKLGTGSSDDGVRPRWFDVDIYERERDGMYVIHTQGKTRVAGERTYIRIVETMSAFDAVSVLVVHHNGKTYIPRQSIRAIAQAAQWDDDMRDAYINRQVS